MRDAQQELQPHSNQADIAKLRHLAPNEGSREEKKAGIILLSARVAMRGKLQKQVIQARAE